MCHVMHYIHSSLPLRENNKLCFWKYNFCFCVQILVYKCTVGVQMYRQQCSVVMLELWIRIAIAI